MARQSRKCTKAVRDLHARLSQTLEDNASLAKRLAAAKRKQHKPRPLHAKASSPPIRPILSRVEAVLL